MNERALALAGVMQGLKLAQSFAQTGTADGDTLQASLATLFRIDADSTEAVYGDAQLMVPGLHALIAQLQGGPARDASCSRMAVTLLHVERKLVGRADLLKTLRDGVGDIERQREHFGIGHPTVVQRLGDLYAQTVSTLSPRVLVQGNPVQLAQPMVVAQIRAALLAAMRSAVLWRQLGGSYWDLLLRRRAILHAARGWLPRES
ncbi:high frequency lysogenization protein HflD [Chiayiivirga flava]|uniref:High frequency lysogenization protein HflD homolog n=1 Tax=Chiayiivirga flava TaxID=659595 RepID=A0A7W8FZI1_9GAMM|nr:high frequency lysogenization protein HflD [Chiayiivirga flava]MBB5208492.1 high frequency lysogenization protein [Chiayiivirga flava]